MERPVIQDPAQRLGGCGCMGVLMLFGMALTVAVVFWIAQMIGTC